MPSKFLIYTIREYGGQSNSLFTVAPQRAFHQATDHHADLRNRAARRSIGHYPMEATIRFHVRTSHHAEDKFTGMTTWVNASPIRKTPGRLGSLNANVISSVWVTRRTSVKNTGLKPMAIGSPL